MLTPVCGADLRREPHGCTHGCLWDPAGHEQLQQRQVRLVWLLGSQEFPQILPGEILPISSERGRREPVERGVTVGRCLVPEIPPNCFLALEVPSLLVLRCRDPVGAGNAAPMPSAPTGALGKGSRGSDELSFQLRSCSVRHSLLPGRVPRLFLHCWPLFWASRAVFLPPGCIFGCPCAICMWQKTASCCKKV